jgi:CRISPR-associated protein Csd2
MQINNRYEMMGIIEVKNSNPNGDPDMDNAPRQDQISGKGLISDVCLKRKIRNVFPKEKVLYVPNTLREEKIKEVLETDKSKGKDVKDKTDIAAKVCKAFIDVRAFGAVLASKEVNASILGPVQFGMAESVVPIHPIELCIASSSLHEKAKTHAENHTLGRKQMVSHAVYVFKAYVSPGAAKNTGLTEEDLAEVIEATRAMFVNDKSAARSEMSLRDLFIFKHATALGNAPSRDVFNTVHVSAINETPTQWEDYEVTVGEPPAGVTMTWVKGLE